MNTATGHIIAWLVPFPLQGSGGHRTIFSHINNLVNHGHTCHIYMIGEECLEHTKDSLKELIEGYFGACYGEVFIGPEIDKEYDLIIATAWWTASLAANHTKSSRKAYFIQDFEPWFNPMGDNYILAENSYRQKLIPITIGCYLSHLMTKNYNTSSHYFDFTANKKNYHPLPGIEKERAVCFVYQPEKPRRCPEIGKDALAIVKAQRPDTTIYTYGTKTLPNFWFNHIHLGILSLQKCNQLYNKSSVGLCLSSSNPSRIPFEMMAAGLPAVDLYGENTIYDLPNKGIILAERNPSSIAGAIIKILDDPQLQKNLSEKGAQFMENKDSELEYQQCASIIKTILTDQQPNIQRQQPIYKLPPYKDNLPIPHCPASPTEEVTSSPSNWLLNNRIARCLKVLFRGYY